MIRHTITVPEQLSQFIGEQVDSGQFGSISDYIRDLIRNDQRRKEKAFAELRQLINEGKQGDPVPFSMEKIIKSAEKKMEV